MDDTRAHKKVQGDLEGESRREYMVALLRELQAMERMVEEGLFERGVQRIGAEQELFLVDGAYHPTPGALKIIQRNYINPGTRRGPAPGMVLNPVSMEFDGNNRPQAK